MGNQQKLPVMIDTETLSTIYQNVLPAPKMGNKGMALNNSILKQLRVVDEQDAINRFVWYNLPHGLNANLLERILYYRGSGMFFYLESNKRFFFLPYVGENIDVYGRYTKAYPIPFNGSTNANEGDEKKAKAWIDGLKWNVEYDVVLPQDLTIPHLNGSCVILNDYSKQLPQKIISRQTLQEPLLQVESEIVPFLRTSLLNSTGIKGVRVNNQDEGYSVQMASNSFIKAGLEGEPLIPIEGSIQMEMLTESGKNGTSEEYLLAMQGIDNLRLSMHGLDNGGLFQKKAHMLQSEQETNGGSTGFILQDCLYQRQEFCNIVNSIWGLGIWCDISETAYEGDRNGDGFIGDEQDPTEGQTNNEMARSDENVYTD